MASNFLNEMKSTYRFSDFLSEPLRILPLIENFEQIPIVSLEESIQPLKILISDIERMVWIVKQNCQQIEDELTFDECASIMLYTIEWKPIENSFYYQFNQILRKENRDLLKPYLLYFKLLLISYTKISTVNNHLTCYRGINMNLSSKYLKGKTIIWWSFSSCTTSEEYLTNFLNEKGVRTLFKIDCQTGKSIQQYTLFPEQQDVLFLPGRQFQIIDNYQEDNDLYIIHLKEIQPFMSFNHYIPSIQQLIRKKSTNHDYFNTKLEYIIDHFKSHNEIKLNKLKLNDFDMDIVSKQAINNKNCMELLLNDNQITSKGILILTTVLYNNTQLNKLVLAKNSIGDLGVLYLSQILATNQTKIRTLDLSSNNITYKGVEYLADMLKTNTILTSLWLNGNEINNQGVDILMNSLIHYNTTLKFLRLSSNPTIDDTSIDSIINMIEQNKTLNYFDIQNCNISLHGKKLIEDVVKTKKQFYLDI